MPVTTIAQVRLVIESSFADVVLNQAKAMPNVEFETAVAAHELTTRKGTPRTRACCAGHEGKAVRFKDWPQRCDPLCEKRGRVRLERAHGG